MTYEEAYLDGFCKAAEAVGANPVQLYKQASRLKFPGSKTISRGLRRYGELLRGGNKVKLAPLNAAKAVLSRGVEQKILKADPGAVAKPLTLLKAYGAKVLGNRGLEAAFAAGYPSAELIRHGGKHPVLAGIGAELLRPAQREIRKVYAARGLTGAGALGGLGGLAALSSDDE